GLYDESSATFVKVDPVQYSPVVSGIPDQSVSEGNTFTTIALDSFVSDFDHTYSEMTWTDSGSVDLIVNINSNTHVATITAPHIDWYGSETITFKATDPDSLSGIDDADFTVIGVNDPPIIQNIHDQSIGEGQLFSFNLDTCVYDVDNPDSEISWNIFGAESLIISLDTLARIATFAAPDSEWAGSEMITFRATDLDGLYDEDSANYTILPVNDPPFVQNFPNPIITQGDTFQIINLDDYVEDIDNVDSVMTWTFSGNIELNVSLNTMSRTASIEVPDSNWFGIDTVVFRAADPAGLYDEDDAIFTVIRNSDTPQVANIPNQIIDEGSIFDTIPLDNYVFDLNNTANEMTWTNSGSDDLIVDIDSITHVATISTPNSNWNGSETIIFRATDPDTLFGEDAVSFTVRPVNDVPFVIAAIPDTSFDEDFGTVTIINWKDVFDDIDINDSLIINAQSVNSIVNPDIIDTNLVLHSINNLNGTDDIIVTATDDSSASVSDTFRINIAAVNDAPHVSGNQFYSTAEGDTFSPINLDDYVLDIDNLDSEISWSYIGNTELFVNINTARFALIFIPNTSWNGSETVTFRATDPEGLYDEIDIDFIVYNINDAPQISFNSIFSISEGDSLFEKILFEEHVEDPDHNYNEISWTILDTANLSVENYSPDSIIVFPNDYDWYGTEILRFIAKDPFNLSDTSIVVFKVLPVNDAPVISQIPTQEISKGESFNKLFLDNYVFDVDNVNSELIWTSLTPGFLKVNIDSNRSADFEILDLNWAGTTEIRFQVSDP
ncbi:MAG: hypothetical protein GY808_15125, partial [Gammaproteobacteria bacterium]|nr:hypothetical protein [Gammaproteobacteria bacterium]